MRRQCIEVCGDGTDFACQVDTRVIHIYLAGVELGDVEQVVDVLEQCRGIALDDCEVTPLQFGEILPGGEHGFRRAEDQRQRRAQLVTDVGEEVALQLVQLPDPVEKTLQFLVLPGDLGLGALLLGDVAAFGKEKHDVTVLVFDGQEGEVDDDCLLASSLTVNLDVAAHELTLTRSLNEVPLVVLGLFRDLPPARLPERFPLNIIQPDTSPFERRPIDFKRHPVGVQQAHELVHLIQDDARELLPVCLESVGRGKRDTANAKRRCVRKQLVVDAQHATSRLL